MRTRLPWIAALLAILGGFAWQVTDRLQLARPPAESPSPVTPQPVGAPSQSQREHEVSRRQPTDSVAQQAASRPASPPAEPPGPGRPSGQPPTPRPPRPAFHVVQPGETLSSIAARYGLTAEELARINRLVYRDVLYAGEILRLSDAPARLLPHTTHVVQPGETLGEIARTHHVPLWALIEANGLTDPDYLPAGVTLKIPRVVYGEGT